VGRSSIATGWFELQTTGGATWRYLGRSRDRAAHLLRRVVGTLGCRGGLATAMQGFSQASDGGNRRCVERGVEWWPWLVGGGSESSPPSGCCRGGLRCNSGDGELNWRGEGLEEVQRREGRRLVCCDRPGGASFYRGSRCCGARGRSSTAWRLRCSKGQARRRRA
jgi:hypothetical protein